MDQLAPPADGRIFEQHGATGAMARLAARNFVLSVLTLSFYRFWGKTRVRRFLWENTTAWGEPLEYTGTGKELFIGFVVVLVAVLLPLIVVMAAIQMAAAAFPPAALLGAPVYLLVLFLVGAGLYRARRYQMSRTVWRGIRGGQDGSAAVYGLTFVLVTLASIVTVGWAGPWGEMKLARYRLANTTFGDRRFQCDATAGPVYNRFAVVWLVGFAAFMAIPLLAAIREDAAPAAPLLPLAMVAIVPLAIAVPLAAYRAAVYRQLAARTRFGGLSFAADIRTWPLVRLVVGNWLITALSLGILRPVAALRTFRFASAALTARGTLDAARLAQGTAARPRTGEGLIAVLDGTGDF